MDNRLAGKKTIHRHIGKSLGVIGASSRVNTSLKHTGQKVSRQEKIRGYRSKNWGSSDILNMVAPFTPSMFWSDPEFAMSIYFIFERTLFGP